jgi:hypothetical protein
MFSLIKQTTARSNLLVRAEAIFLWLYEHSLRGITEKCFYRETASCKTVHLRKFPHSRHNRLPSQECRDCFFFILKLGSTGFDPTGFVQEIFTLDRHPYGCGRTHSIFSAIRADTFSERLAAYSTDRPTPEIWPLSPHQKEFFAHFVAGVTLISQRCDPFYSVEITVIPNETRYWSEIKQLADIS